MRRAYLAYAVRRLVGAAAVVLLTYVLTFVVVSILPGNPVTSVLRNPENGFTEEQINAIIAAQGLDKPVLVQLWSSLTHFLVGDFGLSMGSTRPVAAVIAEALSPTLILASSGLAVALLLAGAIGCAARLLPERLGGGALRALPSLFLSVPGFVVGLVLIHAFGFRLGLFHVIEPDSAWATFFAAVALGIPVSARIAEVLITNLDHEAAQEYVLVARSRGIGPARMLARHLLRPSSLPVVTVAALAVGELLGGSLVTETVFGRTGIGTLVQRAASTHDLPVLQAVVSLAAVVFVLVNLLADLAYPLLDPRMKLVSAARRRPAGADEGGPGHAVAR